MMRVLLISILSLLNGHQKDTVKVMFYRFWYNILSTMKTNISHILVKSANKCVVQSSLTVNSW